MDRLVSNATPLIYLAKVNQLKLFKMLLKEAFTPESVHREVVIYGKSLGEKDAFLVEKAINDGWIAVKNVNHLFEVDIGLHTGEVEVISLAKELGIETVLMDDAKARIAAEVAGQTPRGTLWLLLEAVKNKIMNFDQFLIALEMMTRAGFFLKEEVYLRAVREAKKLSEI